MAILRSFTHILVMGFGFGLGTAGGLLLAQAISDRISEARSRRLRRRRQAMAAAA
jgi:hypothetical protein